MCVVYMGKFQLSVENCIIHNDWWFICFQLPIKQPPMLKLNVGVCKCLQINTVHLNTDNKNSFKDYILIHGHLLSRKLPQ